MELEVNIFDGPKGAMRSFIGFCGRVEPTAHKNRIMVKLRCRSESSLGKCQPLDDDCYASSKVSGITPQLGYTARAFDQML